MRYVIWAMSLLLVGWFVWMLQQPIGVRCEWVATTTPHYLTPECREILEGRR